MPHPSSVTLSLADEEDRQSIYALRHQVYARELGQHRENREGVLTDVLDQVNTYLVAKRGGAIVGFVAITPPNPHGYSVDKYFARRDMPFVFDDGLYEARLLTVVESDRHTMVATLLMYGALRYVESQGARVLVAIGRRQVLSLYERAGLRTHGLQVQAGAVTYELMSADVRDLRRQLGTAAGLIRRFEQLVEWRVNGVPYRPEDGCFHGGAFWEAIGDSFETLERKDRVISADVLDAWFDPAPRVVGALERSSPSRSRPRRQPVARGCAGSSPVHGASPRRAS
jgi:N-acyl-L-homoserine lactone synthetase